MNKLEQEIYDMLSDKYYMTKNIIVAKMGMSRTAVSSALTSLTEQELVDSVLVKAFLSKGRAEVAYLKMEQ